MFRCAFRRGVYACMKGDGSYGFSRNWPIASLLAPWRLDGDLPAFCRTASDLAKDTPSQDGTKHHESHKRSVKLRLLFGIGAAVFGATVYILKTGGYYSETGFKVSKEEKPWVSFLEAQKPEIVELPKEVPYLIIGAGTAAFAAYRAIRAADAKAKVLLVTDDNQLPYMRPPLSKELWYTDDLELLKHLKFKQWNGKERSLFYEKEGFYCKPMELEEKEFGGVAVALGQKVVRLDVKGRCAHFDNGNSVVYGKCLITTGGKPKNLPIIEKAGPDVLARCTLFRNITDFWRLQKVISEAKSVAIVGGGFLGSELACCLGKKGKEKGLKIFQTFPEKGNMGQVLPEYLSKWATEKVKTEGVEVIPDTFVTACSYSRPTRQVILQLSDGQSLSVDHVIVAVGLEPNTELASASGLEIDPRLGGFLVNAELEARSNVWVAGDAACFYDTQLGRRRVEHHDHAVVSGRLAGENMTGAGRAYWHQSMFWSDLGPDIGYEAIGVVDSSLPTVGVFAKATSQDTPHAVVEATGENLRNETEKDALISTSGDGDGQQAATANSREYGKGIVFYLRNNVVVGIVMWNVFNRMAIARQIIKDAKTYEDFTEVAKLFNLYGEPVGDDGTDSDEAETVLEN